MNPLDVFLDALTEVLQSGEQIPDQVIDEILDFLHEEIQSESAPEVPQGTDLLWILSGSNPEAFVSYLRTYPGANFAPLLNNPAQLQRVIGQLSQSIPPSAPAEQDSIPKADLNSSNIYGFSYDPKTKSLYVRFQGGNVYGYEGVPPQIFRVFQAGAIPAKTDGKNEYGQWWQGKKPSLGASFYELIKKGGYPYQKLK